MWDFNYVIVRLRNMTERNVESPPFHVGIILTLRESQHDSGI